MEKEKKKWETPKLICLYRGRPEEAVLVYCKLVDVAGPGAGCGRATYPSGAKCKLETGT